MNDQYRLQFFDAHKACLAINWANAYENRFARGDCVVRAICGTTEVDAHNRARHQHQTYTTPMPIEDVRRYIAEHPLMLGSSVHDCVGIVLEDAGDRFVPFGNPIQVRAA